MGLGEDFKGYYLLLLVLLLSYGMMEERDSLFPSHTGSWPYLSSNAALQLKQDSTSVKTQFALKAKPSLFHWPDGNCSSLRGLRD